MSRCIWYTSAGCAINIELKLHLHVFRILGKLDIFHLKHISITRDHVTVSASIDSPLVCSFRQCSCRKRRAISQSRRTFRITDRRWRAWIGNWWLRFNHRVVNNKKAKRHFPSYFYLCLQHLPVGQSIPAWYCSNLDWIWCAIGLVIMILEP